MRKHVLLLILLSLLTVFSLILCNCTAPSKETSAPENTLPPGLYQENEFIFQDDFDEGSLDLSLWQLTRDGDFAEMTVEVYDVDPTEETDYRLRLLAGTIGTSDDTVKFLGVRSLQSIDFAEGKTISFDLDWNNQANGCYLTAGMYLCPIATDANPRDEADWLAFEYVGVPPGQNARFRVAKKSNGNVCFLFTEGWPDKQRTGRKISNQHVELTIDVEGIKVIENGGEIFSTDDHGINFTQVYLYLQMSSHSNYPSREVYFDNIVVR